MRLHDVLWVPEDGVGVEVVGGVEPEAELLLPLPLPLREHVRVQRVGLARHVAEELEVDLVVGRALRRKLQGAKAANSSTDRGSIRNQQQFCAGAGTVQEIREQLGSAASSGLSVGAAGQRKRRSLPARLIQSGVAARPGPARVGVISV
jgi:hypothetical protein